MEYEQRKGILQGSARLGWNKMSSASTTSKSARIETTASGEWRLLIDDGPPLGFSAIVLARLLRGAREDKIRIADVEKQLDDMSVQCDEKYRLVGEKEELLNVLGFPARVNAGGGEETMRCRSSRKCWWRWRTSSGT
jgi:hypothetical protein